MAGVISHTEYTYVCVKLVIFKIHVSSFNKWLEEVGIDWNNKTDIDRELILLRWSK